MGRTKPYIKFDTTTKHDPKVALLIERHGKSWAWDMTMLFCAMGDYYGSIDLLDEEQVLHAQSLVGRKERRFKEFLEVLAELKLIDATALHEQGRVQSKRSLKDGQARWNRQRYASEASRAAADKRTTAVREPVPQR